MATVDHKPTDTKEHARITDAGGKVLNGRVDGGLALSRAFGDFEYKMRSDLPPVRQKVSAEPDCIYVHRRPGHDEFVLLACDGLWDVSSNEQVCVCVTLSGDFELSHLMYPRLPRSYGSVWQQSRDSLPLRFVVNLSKLRLTAAVGITCQRC